jgi:hypothetical protein
VGNYPLPSSLGTIKKVVAATPGAGVDWTQTVPAGKWWMLISAYAIMTQGITQTPQPILQLDDGATVFFEAPGSTTAQAVSTTCAYTWGPGFTLSGQIGTGAGIRSVSPIPEDIILWAGYRIKVVTVGIGANSQWGAPQLYVAELG